MPVVAPPAMEEMADDEFEDGKPHGISGQLLHH